MSARQERYAAAADAPESWLEANQRYLAAELASLFGSLQKHLAESGSGSAAGGEADGRSAPYPYPGELPPPALETLCSAFHLSPFERSLLLLCAGMELDSRFASLCAAAQGDPQRAYPTFSLALAALPDAHWSALSPAAALRYWRLIEVASGSTLTLSPLRIAEPVLHYLTGISCPDERLAGLVEPVQATTELMPSHRALAAQVAGVWLQAAPESQLPLVQLCGPERSSRHAIAAAACTMSGWELQVITADAIPTLPTDLHALLRLWEREAALTSSALLLECDELESRESPRAGALTWLLEHARGAVLVSSRDRRQLLQRPTITIEVDRPHRAEQVALWREALGTAAPSMNGHIEVLASQFTLGEAAIRAGVAEGLRAPEIGAGGAAPERLALALWDACRVQARPRLDDLAQRIEPAATWDDLVLPGAQRQTLREIAAHVRQRSLVYDRWGFASKGSRGLGISALFSGASGTGKTMAAEVLANELRLDLYRIDLASVVSKYIGETEKNLRRVFDAAEDGCAILLFDEADALFGKRSEVRDSHDRYANLEVSYLLQRMECYRGLAILTTNLKSALDAAFLRRIRFIVRFPFPDAAQRVEIWRCVFPRAAPLEGVDVARLAQLNVTGGNIRSIAMNAAFLAADAGETVGMAHLLQAARSEYEKLEKVLTEAEVVGWVGDGRFGDDKIEKRIHPSSKTNARASEI